MEEELIPVFVHGVVVDSVTNSTIVLLVDEDKKKVLPIWIGAFEAFSISQVLENQTSSRPLTHDLISNILGELKANLLRVVIYTIRNSTFYSYLVLCDREGRRVRVDARPSDAIAIALRTSSPVYVSEEILAVATDYHAVLDHNQTGDGMNNELNSNEIKDWIQHIKPSDF